MNQSINASKHPYTELTPEVVLNAIESVGLKTSARILALNSYENRVYQIGIEDDEPVIAKFYRPNRWSDEQILEEHQFCIDLAKLDNPVIAPIELRDGLTLSNYHGFRFAIYPRQGGYSPELDNLEHLHWIGRVIGRIHALGAIQPFKYRPEIHIKPYVIESSNFIIENGFIPDMLHDAYTSLIEDIKKLLTSPLNSYNHQTIRLHGDCYPSNILWTDKGPHFVDFDDCRNGPAVQDLWMFLSGERREQTIQISELLDGYCEFHDFNPVELNLIESLRTMRLIHYAGWLARRWDDPAFPRSFPWFNTQRYWEEHILMLREQMAALQEEPLQWQ
jgi:Ser/Thr protein kinase RdoA (MazF antagonist)